MDPSIFKTGGVTTPMTVGVTPTPAPVNDPFAAFRFAAPTPPAPAPTVVPKTTVQNLAAQNNTGLAAQAVPMPTGINLQKANLAQVQGVFGGTDGSKYGVTKNADGSYNITPDSLQKLSAGLNSNAIVSSSSSVVNQENGVKSAVTAMTTPTPPADGTDAAQSASDKYLKLLDDQISALEARRASETGAINADFDSQKRSLEGTQKSEVGSTTATIARIGGYLGPSASAMGVMINLAAQHKNEILNLEAKRQSAIQAANVAIDDKQFALARAKVQEVKDIENTIYERKQNFFDNAMKVQDQQMQLDESNRAKYKDDLANLSLLDPADVPTDKKAEIDRFYGTPGFTDKYLAVSSAAAQAKKQSDVIDVQKKMLDLLQNIPQGQTIKFPDGTEYTGMGKVSDTTTYLQTDSNGIGHLVAYNKATGKVSVQSVGAVGKKSTGTGSSAGGVAGVAPTVVDNVKNRIQTTLESSGKDGKYYDPDVYIGVRSELKKTYPQLLTYVDGIFLDKANGYFSENGIKRLRQKGVVYDAPALAGLFTPQAAPVDNSETQSENQP